MHQIDLYRLILNGFTCAFIICTAVSSNILNRVVADEITNGVSWTESKNLSKWYNAFDLCIIHSTSNGSVDEITKGCEKSTVAEVPRLPLVRCRAGNTWPAQAAYCSASDLPFSERKNFQRAISGFDDPSRHSLRSFFQQLSKENGALLIIGDSVMQQFFSAMACELEREGIWKDPGRFTNTDELQYVRVDKNTSAVQIKFLPIYHFVNGRYERIPHAAMHSLKNTLKLMTTEFQSLVVICNMGLHYVDNPVSGFSRRDYQLQMTAALTYMNKFALQHPQKNVRIFWRETSAQHFPTTNGYWPGVKYSNTLRLACVPLADPSPAADWRNRDIENIIISNNLFMIRIIPFYNATIPLWSEHPNGHLKDCTHFCWSPMLYQSVFYEMNRGMEQLWIKSA